MEGTGPMRKITTVYRFKDYDIFLILCVLALSGAGVLLIGSAGPSYQYRQLAGVMLGLLVMGAVSIVDYRILIGHGWSCYAAALVLLFGVSVVGAISGGAARWIEIGPLRFQPSEMSKILLIVFFARLFHDFQDKMDRAVYVFFFVGVLLPPAALILEQPDLYTAVIIFRIGLWDHWQGAPSGNTSWGSRSVSCHTARSDADQ